MKTLPIISAPLSKTTVTNLFAGQEIFISGTIYTGRDAAHARLIDLIKANKKLPVDLKGQILYYTGPTPENPVTKAISAGPTTSGRMDAYTPLLLEKTGLSMIIGKGNRTLPVIDALKRYNAVYCAAGGGLGALIGKCIIATELICWGDLGPEAMYRFEVENLPVVVAIDCKGNNVYEIGQKKYKKF
jgi:fumarate hydratase subunit beta